jgi:hypothetical protein
MIFGALSNLIVAPATVVVAEVARVKVVVPAPETMVVTRLLADPETGGVVGT